jgi:hypothetical protein
LAYQFLVAPKLKVLDLAHEMPVMKAVGIVIGQYAPVVIAIDSGIDIGETVPHQTITFEPDFFLQNSPMPPT